MNHPSIIPSKQRVWRKRKRGKSAAPGVALTLVAADFDPDGPELYLTFDRPIDIGALDLTAFEVRDGINENHLVGFVESTLVNPAEVAVLMHRIAAYTGPDRLLSVGAGNGIVAVDDGGTWAGVVDVVLPFP